MLTEPEKSLIRAAEDNPIDYTLADQNDADAYLHLLLKVIDLTSSQTTSNSNSSSMLRVSKLPLDYILPDDEALQHLYVDCTGVVLHYAISKLSEVLIAIKSEHKKVSLPEIFYPSGILTDDWRPLLRILSGSKTDPYAQRGSAFCLACIVSEGCVLSEQAQLFASISDVLKSFVSWLTSRLHSATSSQALAILLPSLVIILGHAEAREAFNDAGGVGYLSRHLRRRTGDETGSQRVTATVQQLYELTYCMWLLSYDSKESHSIRKHYYRDGAVAALCDLVSAKPREKVVRLALSTLRNLAECTTGLRAQEVNMFDGNAFLTEMIGCGLIKSVDRLLESDIPDPDMAEDVQVLSRLLNETFRHMTRWDVYESEIDSAHLQWSVVHTEKFFRENVRNMEGKDGKFGIVKVGLRYVTAKCFILSPIAHRFCISFTFPVDSHPADKQRRRRCCGYSML